MYNYRICFEEARRRPNNLPNLVIRSGLTAARPPTDWNKDDFIFIHTFFFAFHAYMLLTFVLLSIIFRFTSIGQLFQILFQGVHHR